MTIFTEELWRGEGGGGRAVTPNLLPKSFQKRHQTQIYCFVLKPLPWLIKATGTEGTPGRGEARQSRAGFSLCCVTLDTCWHLSDPRSEAVKW